MYGLYNKFKDGFARTVSIIASKTRGLFGGRKIDAASLDELEEALYTADFGVETTNEILGEIKQAYGTETICRDGGQPRSAPRFCSACSPAAKVFWREGMERPWVRPRPAARLERPSLS